MKTRRIGRTGVEVTELSFGCTGIGNMYRAISHAQAAETLQAAWDAGLRYFDTAPHYGSGLSELRLGQFLYGRPRDSYVVSTKVGRVMEPLRGRPHPGYGFADPLPFEARYDYSYDGIMRAFETSLARLGVDTVDILFLHDIGIVTHGAEENARHMRDLWDSGTRAMEELRSSGAVRACGIGVNEVEICLEIMARWPLDCILLAGRYSVLDRSAERELLGRCAKAGTSLVVGGVFNSGILATGPVPGAHFNYQPASPDILDKVRAMVAVAGEFGFPLAAAALQFPLQHPVVATALVGSGKPSSITRDLPLRDIAIDPAAWARFDELALRP